MSYLATRGIRPLFRHFGSSHVRILNADSLCCGILRTKRFLYAQHKLQNDNVQLDAFFDRGGLERATPSGVPTLMPPRDGTPLRCTEDQWLYCPTRSEVDMFLESSPLPDKPINLEGSVVVRLVDLDAGVTSPVGRSVFFSEYGIRRGECLHILLFGSFVCTVLCSLGYWQLRRRAWKMDLLNTRSVALSQPTVKLRSFAEIEDALGVSDESGASAEYRCVECTGVLDSSCTMLVGPRPPLYGSYGSSSGYYVIRPLRFRDGSCALVNLGWLDNESLLHNYVCPELVTLRGVVVRDDIGESLISSLKLNIVRKYHDLMSLFGYKLPPANVSVNRPRRLLHDDSRKVFRYVDPISMSKEVHSMSPVITGRYVINAYDVVYHDDMTESSISPSPTEHRFKANSRAGINATTTHLGYERRQKSDHLLFYADPDKHSNYAYQWFLMAGSIAMMCIYKLYRVRRTLGTIL
ncbi:Cytochrome oxidase assembly protein shy1 [Babesia sp. Xinjiang]|uniref:Cytochrome oxidase assembly protein shy1 n=1 Tax=Babesia sp. Xinjiang TaxID=462227 RepID=UPI000A232EE5|nr:Cytochrome oxidase assembly protein shy1 [Babesia sp. Xinjiang]ORM41463.1 Cytochrome oxidase assembly protein shy1 [Babesia sp. Xinjiang]